MIYIPVIAFVVNRPVLDDIGLDVGVVLLVVLVVVMLVVVLL